MAGVVRPLGAPSTYKDWRYEGGVEQFDRDVAVSSTLYVGNLSFFTTEEQIYELFSKCGEIKRIIMGLDRIKKTPCGFCFVEFYRRQDALDCMSFVNGTKLDERIVRTDVDPGFRMGRQYGRGRSGGQVRDEHREDYDEGRGGWGARMREDEVREQQQRDVYGGPGGLADVPQGSSDFYTKAYLRAPAAGDGGKRGRDGDGDGDGDADAAAAARRRRDQRAEGGDSGSDGGSDDDPFCAVCGGTADCNAAHDPEDMLSCADCPVSAHASCLKPTAASQARIAAVPWQCAECRCCAFCGNRGDDDRLLLCDDCDRGAHIYCLDPPLPSIPDGDWVCEECTAARPPAAKTAQVPPNPPFEDAHPAGPKLAKIPQPAAMQPPQIPASDLSARPPLAPTTPAPAAANAAPSVTPATSLSSPDSPAVPADPTAAAAARQRRRRQLGPASPPAWVDKAQAVLFFGNKLLPEDADVSRCTPQPKDRLLFQQARDLAYRAEQRLRDAAIKASGGGAAASLDTSGERALPRIPLIRIGKWQISTWYAAPYPEEYNVLPTLFLCEFCLKYMKSDFTLERHKLKCPLKHPPGDEIYRDGDISVFEVDGRKNKIYCQNLCLLAKMFLDHKTLYYDVEPFLFYVMTKNDEHGCHLIGYFSKEKRSSSNYNLSCIMTLPVHQRRGYGNFLIDFSYLLSKHEEKPGSPEKPLSDLGAFSYRYYWRATIVRTILELDKTQISIQELSRRTRMTVDDVVLTLHLLGMLVKDATGRYVIRCNMPALRELDDKIRAKGHLVVKPENLRWSPFLFKRSHSAAFPSSPSNSEERDKDTAEAAATTAPLPNGAHGVNGDSCGQLNGSQTHSDAAEQPDAVKIEPAEHIPASQHSSPQAKRIALGTHVGADAKANGKADVNADGNAAPSAMVE
ncbi:Histone acetyltransferase [Polyrhizophydium stewartii]|uniref:Histone acetyltransferase n=1 Tax=Polyrhizophydium stewartii TaxID=2732419 RepID=A0ABR4MWY3_9FUNG